MLTLADMWQVASLWSHCRVRCPKRHSSLRPQQQAWITGDDVPTRWNLRRNVQQETRQAVPILPNLNPWWLPSRVLSPKGSISVRRCSVSAHCSKSGNNASIHSWASSRTSVYRGVVTDLLRWQQTGAPREECFLAASQSWHGTQNPEHESVYTFGICCFTPESKSNLSIPVPCYSTCLACRLPSLPRSPWPFVSSFYQCSTISVIQKDFANTLLFLRLQVSQTCPTVGWVRVDSGQEIYTSFTKRTPSCG